MACQQATRKQHDMCYHERLKATWRVGRSDDGNFPEMTLLSRILKISKFQAGGQEKGERGNGRYKGMKSHGQS